MRLHALLCRAVKWPRNRVHVTRQHLRVATLAAISSLSPGSILAAQGTTGSLEIRVVGQDGAPLAEALVQAVGPVRPVERESDRLGRAVFPGLVVGAYDILVRRVGYRPVHVRGLPVRLGQTTVHDVQLVQSTTLVDSIAVTAAPGAFEGSAVLGASLPRTDIDELPLPRNYAAIATILPHNNASTLGDQVNVAGGTGLENTYYINGVNVTDVLGVRTSGTRLPYNFIQDIEVRTGGYEAEYRSSLGGILNVVTPSGTNDARLELFAFGVHNKLAGTAREGLAEPQSRGAYAVDAGFSAGGPLRRDRLWYYVAYDITTESDELLLPGSGFFRDHETVHAFAGKLTWQPRPTTTLEVTVLGDPSTRRAVGSTFGSYGPVQSYASPNAALGALKRGGVTAAARFRHMVRPALLLEAAASRFGATDENLPRTPGDTAILFGDFTTATRSGGYPERIRYRTTRTALSAALTLVSERHVAKAGVEYVNAGLDQDATLRSLFYLGVDPGSGDSTFMIFLNDAHGTAHNRMPSVFVQDAWRLSGRVTLHAGLRWDGQYLVNSLGHVTARIESQWQPRFGLVARTDRAGRGTFRASFARFYQDLHLAASGLYHDLTNVFSFTFFDHDPRADSSGGVTANIPFDPASPGLLGQSEDEWTVGWDRQLGRSARVGVRAIARRLRNGIEDGTDAATSTNVLGNPGRGRMAAFPAMRREYHAFEFTLSGSPSRTLRLMGSYVLSRTHGNYGGLFNADMGFVFANRNGWWDNSNEPSEFSYGDLPNDRRHVVKIAGSWQAARRLRTGLFATWSSGTPLSELAGSINGPYVTFVGPRGSAGRLPSLFDLNLHAAWLVGRVVPRGGATTINADIFHLGGGRTPVMQDQQRWLDPGATVPSVTFGRATRYSEPVSVRLGMQTVF